MPGGPDAGPCRKPQGVAGTITMSHKLHFAVGATAPGGNTIKSIVGQSDTVLVYKAEDGARQDELGSALFNALTADSEESALESLRAGAGTHPAHRLHPGGPAGIRLGHPLPGCIADPDGGAVRSIPHRGGQGQPGRRPGGQLHGGAARVLLCLRIQRALCAGDAGRPGEVAAVLQGGGGRPQRRTSEGRGGAGCLGLVSNAGLPAARCAAGLVAARGGQRHLLLPAP